MTKRTRGASLLSYGLIVGLVSVVALVAVTSVGSSNKALMDEVGTTLTGVTQSSATVDATPETPPAASMRASCLEILNASESTGNGEYTIDRGSGDETVFCDMDGGGWTWPNDDATSFAQTLLYIPADEDTNPGIDNVAAGAASVSLNQVVYTDTQSVFGANSIDVTNNLNISNLPALAGDFTIDFRIRIDALGSMCAPIFAFGVHNSTGGLTLFNCSSTPSDVSAGLFLGSSGWAGGSSSAAYGGAVQTDVWRHIAVTRDSNTVRTFIDGSLHQSGTYSTSVISSPLQFLQRTNNAPYSMDGQMEEIRLVNGTAVWTSNFTPPTEPYAFQ